MQINPSFLHLQTSTFGFKYRTRANKGRSWLVAVPILRNHAKTHFLHAFIWLSKGQNKNFWIVAEPLIGSGKVVDL